ncbi:MAG: hypothetical protein QOI42_924 [Frankiaceae bacterium]|nr:hypothetical protein [Frankiaceae bacterium]
MRAPHAQLLGDRGDIVIGWLTRLLVVMALIGVSLIDGVSVLKAHYGTQGDADLAATQASSAFAQTHDKAAAYQAALDVATPNDEAISKKQFHVDVRTGVVRLTLTREATTVVLSHIAPLRKYGEISAVASAAPTPASALPTP